MSNGRAWIIAMWVGAIAALCSAGWTEPLLKSEPQNAKRNAPLVQKKNERLDTRITRTDNRVNAEKPGAPVRAKEGRNAVNRGREKQAPGTSTESDPGSNTLFGADTSAHVGARAIGEKKSAKPDRR